MLDAIVGAAVQVFKSAWWLLPVALVVRIIRGAINTRSKLK